MNKNPSMPTNSNKSSRLYHYLGMLAFGVAYSTFLNAVIVGRPFTSYEVARGFGGGLFFLFIGFLLTAWKGPNVGWVAVIICAFFSYMGT